MKFQVTLAVIVTLVQCVRCAVIISHSDTQSDSKAEVEATYAAETFNLIAGVIPYKDKLLYRGYHTKPAVANIVHNEDVTYKVPSNAKIKISYVSALAVGGTTTAFAEITQGGVNDNNITIRLSSASGYGYRFWIEIWGHIDKPSTS